MSKTVIRYCPNCGGVLKKQIELTERILQEAIPTVTIKYVHKRGAVIRVDTPGEPTARVTQSRIYYACTECRAVFPQMFIIDRKSWERKCASFIKQRGGSKN